MRSTVSIRELQRDTSGVVRRVTRTGRPALVTKRGEPVAAVIPVDPDLLEDFILANAPSFVRGMARADRELVEGRTRPLTEVLSEIRGAPARSTRAASGPDLTPREREVLLHIAQGKSAGATAALLGVSPKTVRTHIRDIFRKLDPSSREELVEEPR